MRCDIVISMLHGRIDKVVYEKKYKVLPEQLFPEEFNLLGENSVIEICDKEIKLNEKSINKMEGLCRLFFDRRNEENYRERENRRVDYQFYQVSYTDIE